MNIHYIQHVPFEGLGSMAPWLTGNGHSIACTALWNDDPLPSLQDLDVLIIMGGPMSVYDDPLYPWLTREKTFIRQAILEQKIVIGICLGAQLLAAVLGAEVYRNQWQEIGWFPVRVAPSFAQWLQRPVAPALTVFHWHGDTFTLPPGAVNHLDSAACPHQLFTVGDRVIGIQFHPEATPAAVQDMADHEGDELSLAPYIQDRETILSPAHHQAGNRLMEEILDRLLHTPDANHVGI